jgi:uncharacterized protein (TIGR02147 family)
MEALSVFSYSNPRQFLLDSLADRQKKSSGFSVRSWAKEMGLPSHTLLVMLLGGKRPLRVKHASFLAKGLKLSAHETLYLQALLQFDSSTAPEEKQLCELWLSELNPGRTFRVKEMDSFAAISHWLYTAILAMTDLKDFDFNEENIVGRLGGKAKAIEVRGALERLFNLGLLIKTSDGKTKCTYERVTTKNDIRDEGVKKYHQSTSELAKQAVAELPPELREFQSFSLTIDEDKLGLAKEMIRKFRVQLAEAVGSENGNSVYQTNIQFFQLTESPVAKATEDEGVESGWNQTRIATQEV